MNTVTFIAGIIIILSGVLIIYYLLKSSKSQRSKYDGIEEKSETKDYSVLESVRNKFYTLVSVSEAEDDYQSKKFLPVVRRLYKLKDVITLEDGSGSRTMKVSEWLVADPVLFDKTRKKIPFKIHHEVFEIMISKLRVHHPEYFRDALGLKTRIEFKGYDRPVHASVVYNLKPVEFYKWWCENQHEVFMTLQEKITLFEKVYYKKPKVLKTEHKRLINRR